MSTGIDSTNPEDQGLDQAGAGTAVAAEAPPPSEELVQDQPAAEQGGTAEAAGPTADGAAPAADNDASAAPPAGGETAPATETETQGPPQVEDEPNSLAAIEAELAAEVSDEQPEEPGGRYRGREARPVPGRARRRLIG